MRASLLSGTAVAVVDQLTGRTIGIGAALLATVLATAAVQAGRFVVDRMETHLRERGVARRPRDRAGRRHVTRPTCSTSSTRHAEAGWTILGCVGACAPEAADRGVTYIGTSDDLVQTVSATGASIVVATVDALEERGHLRPTPRTAAWRDRCAGPRRPARDRPS